MEIVIYLILFLFLLLTLIPIVGQVYFSNQKVKGKLNFPLYGINIIAILTELIASFLCTNLTLNVLTDQTTRESLEATCLLAATIFSGIGVLGVPLIQPLLALFYYIKTYKD